MQQTLSRWSVVAGTVVACIMLENVRLAGAQQNAAAGGAARRAFDEARALMNSGNFTDACPKLEESLALHPALGVRFNLAWCYRNTQRPASAWLHYREVAKEVGTVRAKMAREAVAELQPDLPRLVVQATMVASIPGLVITRDGAPVGAGSFGKVIYVDPGEQVLRATAPGYLPLEIRVQVDMGEQVVVVVPALQPEPARPADGEPGADPEPVDVAAETEPLLAARTSARGPGTRRTVAWLAGGGGVVMLAASLGLGMSARAMWRDAEDTGRCEPRTLICQDPRGPGMAATARSRVRVSNIAAGAGGALLVTGAVFYWMSRDAAGDSRSPRILPTAGPAGVGMAISGAF